MVLNEQDFECHVCQEVTLGLDPMVKHMRQHFPLPPEVKAKGPGPKLKTFHCCVCPEKFVLRRSLKIHVWKHFFDQDVLKNFVQKSAASALHRSGH